MLSCFNLAKSEDIVPFRNAYKAFLANMKAIDLVEETGPIGRRQADTPMDTDDERDHEYFVIMSFRDRAQVDAAYAYLTEQAQAPHDSVLKHVVDPVFICWQDMD